MYMYIYIYIYIYVYLHRAPYNQHLAADIRRP